MAETQQTFGTNNMATNDKPSMTPGHGRLWPSLSIQREPAVGCEIGNAECAACCAG
ncbi:MAG: hypothetical protein QOD29_4092 [Alphaproteobacteria bacterium]|nr:hypothetical protein [Alphaproteobacteria bacterium]